MWLKKWQEIYDEGNQKWAFWSLALGYWKLSMSKVKKTFKKKQRSLLNAKTECKELESKVCGEQLWSAEDERIATVCASFKRTSTCMCINISISLYHNYNHLGTTRIVQQSCLMSYVWSSTLTLEDHGCWDTTFSMCFLCSFLESLSFKESLCQWSKPRLVGCCWILNKRSVWYVCRCLPCFNSFIRVFP